MTTNDKIKCPHCDYESTARGLKTHIRAKHPLTESTATTEENQESKAATETKESKAVTETKESVEGDVEIIEAPAVSRVQKKTKKELSEAEEVESVVKDSFISKHKGKILAGVGLVVGVIVAFFALLLATNKKRDIVDDRTEPETIATDDMTPRPSNIGRRGV